MIRKLNSDIQERVPEVELSLLVICRPLRSLSSKQPDDKVQNDGEHNADYHKMGKVKKPLSEVFEGKPHLERLLRQNGGNTDNI